MQIDQEEPNALVQIILLLNLAKERYKDNLLFYKSIFNIVMDGVTPLEHITGMAQNATEDQERNHYEQVRKILEKAQQESLSAGPLRVSDL